MGKVKKVYGTVKKYARKQYKRAYGAVKKRYTGKQGMENLWNDISMLKTAINVEKKYIQSTSPLGTIGFAAGTVISPMDGLTEGTGEDQRIGDQVKFLWTQQRVFLELNASGLTAANSSMIRFIQLIDLEPRGDAILNAGQLSSFVLQNNTTGVNQMMSYYNNNGLNSVGDRFKIIKDFRIKLDNVERKQRYVKLNWDYTKLYPKTKGVRVHYTQDGTNTPKNVRFYTLVLCDDSNVTPVTQILIDQRSCFVDN